MSGPGTSSAPARGPAARWRHFARRYGWRAYAVPILGVVTVVALLHDSPSSGSTPAAQGHRGTVTVEGRSAQDANYRPGDTPAPVVVQLGSDVTSCSDNTYSKLLLVSVSQQHLWACQGQKAGELHAGDDRGEGAPPADAAGLVAGAGQAAQPVPRRPRIPRLRALLDAVQRRLRPARRVVADHAVRLVAVADTGFARLRPRPHQTMAWIYRWARVGSTVVTDREVTPDRLGGRGYRRITGV